MTNTLLNNIQIQATVIVPNVLNTWVDFNVDVRDSENRYTLANTKDSLKYICKKIAEELLSEDEDSVYYGCSYDCIREIVLKNGVRIVIGKFWPEEVQGWDKDTYVRMWRQETPISEHQLISEIVECAKKKRTL